MPAFNPLGSITGKTSATLFEIRLDNDFVVLRGTESEASDQVLEGSVVLCLPAALKVEDVHLKLAGVAKIGWNDQHLTPSGISNNRVDKTTEILNYKFPPFVGGGPGSSSRGTTLPAGNYEWPFQYTIKGETLESVEGLDYSHIKYKLKATVARGKLAYDLHAYKAVRIIRTLDPSALELSHAMTVENIWPNKVEYQLIIPQKAIIFGTQIEVEMRFTSLLKGLKIGTIKCVLVESQDYTIPAHLAQYERSFKTTRNIGEWEFSLRDDDFSEMMESGQDGWTLKETLPLPKSLAKCMQDVDLFGIKIRHKVKFNISLHNPDGHTSELRATLPVTIFISPNMAINDQGFLVDQTPLSAQAAADIAVHAPPLYGEHVLDQIYAGLDSGLMTPHPQSGMNTPHGGLSRSGSSENIASLDGAVENPAGPGLADQLSSRLRDLDINHRNSSFGRRPGVSGTNTPRYPQSHYHAQEQNNYFGSHSADHSNPLSRRTSEDDVNAHEHGRAGLSALTSGQHTPAEHVDYSENELAKVPSYNTATRAAPKRGMSYSEALPNYDTAIATPGGTNMSPTTPGGSRAGNQNQHGRAGLLTAALLNFQTSSTT